MHLFNYFVLTDNKEITKNNIITVVCKLFVLFTNVCLHKFSNHGDDFIIKPIKFLVLWD